MFLVIFIVATFWIPLKRPSGAGWVNYESALQHNTVLPLKMMSSSTFDTEWHSFYINDKINYNNPIYKRKFLILNSIGTRKNLERYTQNYKSQVPLGSEITLDLYVFCTKFK